MPAGVLIDERGEPWPAHSLLLARRLGYDDARLDLARFAVARRGFVHLRPIEDGVRVALCPGAFSRVTLAGTLQALNELAPRRILLVTDTSAELFASVFAFIEHAEYLAADPPIEIRVPRLAVPRGLHNLATAFFTAARPIVELWKRRRGELTDEIDNALAAGGIAQRMILARQLPRSSRLITERFGSGHDHLLPQEISSIIGCDVHERPDREYGTWIAQAYADALFHRSPCLESIRCRVQTSASQTLRARYDRVLLPWRSHGSEMFVMSVSLRRELSVVA